MHLLAGIALLAVLSTTSCLPVSGPSASQHRVQAGNGKGHMIKAILEKRLAEHVENRLTARFGPKRAFPSPNSRSDFPAPAEQPAATTAPDASAVSMGSQDYYDMFWLGNITIGTPDQGPFSVNFDTGSSDLWVVDSTCGTGRSSRTLKQCNTQPLYNASASSTNVVDGKWFGIRYVDGSYAVGQQTVETVKIMDASGNSPLVIPNQNFAQAYDVDKNTMLSPMAGILGLGFQCSSSNYRVPPFINAVNQGLVPQSIFTIYLETESDESQVDAAPAGGTFTFGGLDSTNCGDVIDWIDLTGTSAYMFSYQGINVGSKSMPIYGMDVISDSGTSLILGDSQMVAPIAKAVGAKLNNDYNVYTVKCDASYTAVSFVVNGNSYNLTSSVLSIDIGFGNNKCLFGMIPIDKMWQWGIDWLLGDPWIRQYCAVHDVVNQQIGFAPATAMQSS